MELSEKEKKFIQEKFDSASNLPNFTLLLNVDNENSVSILSTIDSLVSQLYENWVVHIRANIQLDPMLAAKISELEDRRIIISDSQPKSIDDWVVEISSGTRLHPAALSALTYLALKDPKVLVSYADHDHVDTSGVFCDPYMKPDWNQDLLNATNYFAPFVAYKKQIWEANRNDWLDENDFLINVLKDMKNEQIAHLPFVLSSVEIDESSSHLEPVCKRITRHLPDPKPKVSILVPTRDQGNLLERCLKTLLTVTDYAEYEIILINHESSEPKAIRVIQEYSAHNNFRVENFSGAFNFSAIMNYAASLAEGDVLVLLNNDTEIVEPDWLTELVSQVSRPEVGVAGPLLLFGDGTIQHAGIHPGLGGLMGHGHKHLPDGSPGYFNRLKAVHEVAAVTGACLVIKKSIWDELGGLDEKNLPVAYNDVDLCIKARQRGLKIIFTPYSKVVHHESVSRGVDTPPKRNERLKGEIQAMQDKWGALLYFDPAYSPNLILNGGGFKLAPIPRVLPFWKDKITDYS